MFRFAYLREGKHQPTLGAQLEFSHSSNANVSAMVQWGPAVGKSSVAFTLLGGITEYEVTSWNGETHMTPLFGAGLKLYPQDTMAIDATTSIKLRSDFDAPSLYHYEIGVRVYITPRLNLRAGYGQLYLGEQDITVMQIGLGYTF